MYPLIRREITWAVLGCGLAVTLFLSPALFTGRFLSAADMLFGYYPWRAQAPPGWAGTSNPALFDGPLVLEPWLAYSARRLQAGSLPLWNPDNMLGTPLIGNLQSGVLYPGNWPAFLWPGGAMLALTAWLKLFIAALGMYLLARQVFRIGPLGASIAAITFAFGAYMTDWLIWALAATVAWLPWAWWATAQLLARPGPRWVAVLAGIVALVLLAGHAETSYFVLLATGLFAVFQACQTTPRRPLPIAARLALWAAALGLGALLAAAQLLPFAEALGQSAILTERARAAPDTGLPFYFVWTLISPDWFGNPAHGDWWKPAITYEDTNGFAGVLVLVLAPGALLVRDRAQRRLTWFLLAASGLALGMMYRVPGIAQVLGAVPLLRFALTYRFVFLLEFALGLLAGLGIDGLRQSLPTARRRLAGWFAAWLLVLWAAGVGVPWLFARSYFQLPTDPATAVRAWETSMLRATAVLLVCGALLAVVIGWRAAALRLRRAHWLLFPLVLLADVWQAHGDFNPTIAPPLYFPATALTRFLQQQPEPFRIMAADHVLLQETNLVYGISDLRGYDAVEPQLYRELVAGFDPTSLQTRGGMFHPFARTPSALWNLLNVRYLLAAPGDDPNVGVDVRQETSTAQVVGEIYGAKRPGQTFLPTQDNLSAIEVLGATYTGQARGRLILHVKADPTAPADLATGVLDLAGLTDGNYWTIPFAPIRQARGRRFYFYIEAPDAQPGHAATLWYSERDVYRSGTRMEGGQPAPGDLAFRTEIRYDADAPWFVLVFDGGATQASVYENRRALPRAWLTHQVEVQPDPARQVPRLADPAFDAAGTALLAAPGGHAGPPLPAAPPPAGADTVRITRYAPEHVDIATQSPAPGLLILADQAFPGWEARVDGAPAPILTVDHALRGVYLPAGAHAVRFVYAPASFAIGAILSGGALLLVLILTGWPLLRKRTAETPRRGVSSTKDTKNTKEMNETKDMKDSSC